MAQATVPSEPLVSLDPNQILDVLDLTRPGLEQVRQATERGDRDGALALLLAYFRKRHANPADPGSPRQSIGTADQIVQHIFQWGPYPAADYGQRITWDADPAGDIEWVARVYRFYWALTLAQAYARSGDETYAAAFVEMVSDWIDQHRLEDSLPRPLPGYGRPGFAWLDLQTGVRAEHLCRALPVMVHAPCFTPAFLAKLLASLHDHQIKSLRRPKPIVHNKSMFELGGIAAVIGALPEFKETSAWRDEVARRAYEHLLAQTTPSGVQREWCGGYHLGVLRDAVNIMDRLRAAGKAMPDDYIERVGRMHEYVLAIATPDLGFPIFGDTKRPPSPSADRATWSLYEFLVQASRRYDDPRYAAVARLDETALPAQTSQAFPDAGHYVLRSGWSLDDIYMAIHCPPPSLRQKGNPGHGHDEPDNGTFELHGHGRWLMTDTGFYIYANARDTEKRWWHRRTCQHQTLTLDEQDTWVLGQCMLWATAPSTDTLVIENRSYESLTHRRTIWFVDRRFFVFLDEAIGDAPGKVDLHFQFAPGPVTVDAARRIAHTRFADGNVAVWQPAWCPTTLEAGDGWCAVDYGRREPRTAIRWRHQHAAPAAFFTVVVPYRGQEAPKVDLEAPADHVVGAPSVELTVRLNEQTWRIGRDIAGGSAWAHDNP